MIFVKQPKMGTYSGLRHTQVLINHELLQAARQGNLRWRADSLVRCALTRGWGELVRTVVLLRQDLPTRSLFYKVDPGG